jgi:hypothetical protein
MKIKEKGSGLTALVTRKVKEMGMAKAPVAQASDDPGAGQNLARH